MEQTNKVNQSQVLIIISLIIIIIILLMQKCSNYSNAKEKQMLMSSLEDTVKLWKDKDSATHAKISIIEDYNTKQFKYLKLKNKELIELQALVKKYESSIKNGGSVTHFKDVVTLKNVFITKVDTVYKDNYLIDKIRYKSEFNLNDWVVGNIVADADTTTLNMKIKNDYVVVLGSEYQGLFKKRKPYAEVINKNPYSQIAQLRSYQVKNKSPSKVGIGITTGYGITSSFVPSFFLGIGVQYQIIRF